MRITSLECWTQRFELQDPYEIAYEEITDTTNVFVRASTDVGITGWGCAAPDQEVTGESAHSVEVNFKSIAEPYLLGQDPFNYGRILEQLRNQLPKHPSTLAMLDMLLYDLIGKKCKEPVYRLLGGYRDSIPTSITIGILPVKETVQKASELVRKGFSILKVKGGNDLEEDVERIIKIREKLGMDLEIRFDANQGYSVKEAIRFIALTKKYKIELLEQPTIRDNTSLLKEVTTQVHIPVMADESLITLKDVFHLTSSGSTDMINIKLMKVGGITEAIRINAVAKAAGVESMVGCMDESAMGIAAGLHFALARPNIIYADLDGHFDLVGDPYSTMVTCKKGVLYPAEGPGFGWE